MSTERHWIEVSSISVEIHRKAIKNLHVGVYPPDGRVRIAAPERLDDDAVRLALVSRLSWIRRQQQAFHEQPRESAREMVTGESHYFRGRRYRLDVIESLGRSEVRQTRNDKLELHVHPGTDTEGRRRVLERWYRQQMRRLLPELLTIWEPVVGERVAECRIKRMKTRWGSCNIEERRIWLNLELMKKPPRCLEYILVHEMVHLLERHHTDRFRSLMDRLLPDWRVRRDELNSAPLAHDDWEY